jgi:putative ABC transport system ATP-binding protein
MNPRAQTLWRRKNVGVVFRAFTLVPVLNVRENVGLPLFPANLSRRQKRARVDAVLEMAGLTRVGRLYPRGLSSEQQQRAAIARAMVMDPQLILADEPTGELNAQATEEILILLSRLNSESGKTLIIATHDEEVASHAQRACRLNKGVCVETEPVRGRVHGISGVR